MTQTLAYLYLSDSNQQELSNEYQHDRVKIMFKYFLVMFLEQKCTLKESEIFDCECMEREGLLHK